MRYDLESTLPERAFKKSLFKNAPATLEGGGKGGGTPAPTQATSYQTNIPEYAKPYVTNMLNATQGQLFNTGQNAEGNTEITGFKPYKPYSSNPSDYYAGFSPLQQQAQSSAANLQMPGQFGQGSAMTGMAGMGALGTTGQAGMYGAQGNMAGQQAAGMSNMYGGLGAQSGQQAAGMSNMYGGLGAQSGQQYAGMSAGAGQQGSDIGQQYAGQSGMYGGLGAMQGQQGANIGQSLGQMSTNPGSVQAYMNPYLQNALQPQLEEMQRQYGITGTQQASQATQQGAFGGGRDAIMAAENQRNKNTAMNQAIGQGYNTAFGQAQQQMNAANQAALSGNQQALSGYGMGLQGAGQAGTQALAGNQQALSGYGQAGSQALAGYGMGLQGAGQAGSQSLAGYGMGLQGAGQAGQQGIAGAQAGLQGVGAQQAGYGQAGQAGASLANIGNQQLAAQQGIIGTQNQLGGQQQAAEQSKINQSVQDYATAQQYPMMQLGMMSNMLRGLPMQSTAVQSYQAQAPVAQQAAGLLGAYNAYAGKKEGGAIKAMAKGGIADVIPGYKSGVLARVENSIDDIAQSDAYAQAGQKQLPKLMQQSTSPGIKQLIATKQAEDQMGQNISGVAAGNTGDLGMNMAEGGIIPRFAGGTEIKDPMSLDAIAKQAMVGYATPEEALQTQQGLRNTALQSIQGNLSPEELEQQKYVTERRTGLSDKQRRAERMNEALAFLKFGSTPGGIAAGALEAGKDYMVGQGNIQSKYDEMNDNLIKQAADIKRAQRQEANGNATAAEASRDKAQTHAFKAAEIKAQLLNAKEIAAGNNAATLGAAATSAAAHNSSRMYEQNMIAEYAKENGITPAAAYAQLVKGAANKQEKLEIDRAKIQLEATVKADAILNNDMVYVGLINSTKPEDREKAKIIRKAKIDEYTAAGTPNPIVKKPPPEAKNNEVDKNNPLLNK
jgi:hypothetical protein